MQGTPIDQGERKNGAYTKYVSILSSPVYAGNTVCALRRDLEQVLTDREIPRLGRPAKTREMFNSTNWDGHETFSNVLATSLFSLTSPQKRSTCYRILNRAGIFHPLGGLSSNPVLVRVYHAGTALVEYRGAVSRNASIQADAETVPQTCAVSGWIPDKRPKTKY